MSKKVYIYTLSEDGSDDVKYIGQTVSPGTRLIGHINNDGLLESNPKHVWVEDVKARNGKIAMSIIDECDLGEAVEREQYWIDSYNAQGADLLNTARPIRSVAVTMENIRDAKPVYSYDGRVSSRDFQREIGKYIEVAATGTPLTVIRHSRPTAVLISHEMYIRLCERDATLQRWENGRAGENNNADEMEKLYALLYMAMKDGDVTVDEAKEGAAFVRNAWKGEVQP